jgi:hypothetical protein
VDRALRYLARTQRGDGGFGTLDGLPSNVQSAAWVVQGLAAVGKGAARLREGGRSPLDYIRGLQARDGSFRYSGGSDQTPVWVTAQAIPALEQEEFPLRPVARERGGGGGTRAGGGGSGGTAAAGGGGPANGSITGTGSGDGALLGGGAGGSIDGGAGGGPSGRAKAGNEGKRSRGGGPRGGSPGEAPSQFDEPEELEPAPADEDAETPASEGGSMVGGLIAAASSAALVIGLRRRLNGRASSEA